MREFKDADVVVDASLLLQVRQLIARVAMVSLDEVRPEGLLVGYGLDSVRVVDLLDEANDELGVTLDERDLEYLRTVNDVARRVQRKRGPL